MRDALARWLVTIGRPNMKEQDIARWMKDGERAILDIVLRDPRLGEVSVDVSIVDAAHLDAARGAPMTIQRREKAKHSRYPGPGLYPFVLDTRGKWGREAQAMVQALTIDMDPEERKKAVRSCRYMVARALQLSVADQLLSSAQSVGNRSLLAQAGPCYPVSGGSGARGMGGAPAPQLQGDISEYL